MFGVPMLTSLAHAGYALMLAAFLARDILYLRGLLVLAQALVALYAGMAGILPVAIWNGLFSLINATMLAQVVRERRAVRLPAELQPLYERHFAALTPPEFMRWWSAGRIQNVRGVPLTRDGARPSALYFLLDGTVRVSRHGIIITELPAGYFVGEMSLLTGNTANADADAVGDARVIAWPIDQLDEMRRRSPVLWTKVQSAIGHDLVEKIRRIETRPAVVTAPV